MIRSVVDSIAEKMDYSYKDVCLGLVYPIWVKSQFLPCEHGDVYNARAVPNAKKTSIVYWEDHGSVVQDSCKRYRRVTHILRLIIWINKKYADIDFDDYVKEVLWSVPRKVGSATVRIKDELPKTVAIFDRYTYNDGKHYVTHPYDVAAFEVRVTHTDGGC